LNTNPIGEDGERLLTEVLETSASLTSIDMSCMIEKYSSTDFGLSSLNIIIEQCAEKHSNEKRKILPWIRIV